MEAPLQPHCISAVEPFAPSVYRSCQALQSRSPVPVAARSVRLHAMRTLALVVLWALLIVAVLTALLFGAVIIFGEDGETRLGGALISGLAVSVFFGLRAGIRRLRRRTPQPDPLFGTATTVHHTAEAGNVSPSLNPRDYGLPE